MSSKRALVTSEEDLAPADVGAFRESFEVFYARELKPVVGLAYVLSGSRTAAEDLAQEAFLAAYRQWHRIGDYDNPGAWVRRVVSYRAVSRFRRTVAESRALLRLDRSAYAIPEVDPEAEVVWREVRQLPPRQAQVIALRYLNQCTVSEIAAVLELSISTVKTHLRRGREALAACLEETYR